MKLIERIDDNGYKHLSWIKDGDKPDATGLPQDPPDVNRIDWEQVKRELNNALVDRRILSWDDVIRHQTALTSITSSIIKKHLIFLFREGEIK